jgi:hypothetical protein
MVVSTISVKFIPNTKLENNNDKLR